MLAKQKINKFVNMRDFMGGILPLLDNDFAKVGEERLEQRVHAERRHGQTDVKRSKDSRILEVGLLKKFGDFGLFGVELKELQKKA